jgi:glutamate decarboxylase
VSGHGLTIPGGGQRTALVECHRPQKLVKLLDFQLPKGQGKGREGLLSMVESILKYSVNTWDQGYMHTLYSSTNAVRMLTSILSILLITA